MDSFTEGILSRARERQKMLEGYSGTKKNITLTSSTPKKAVQSSSQPNLNQVSHVDLSNVDKKVCSEGNISKISTQNTRVSSEFLSSPNSPKLQKTLNIQRDNFNMEIKVSSVDNVRLEVQIEEQSDDDENDDGRVEGGLRPDAKHRLNRLGKLYAGGDEADISSPIHRTEGKFHAEETIPLLKSEKSNSKRGLSKLADLAQNINQWEDELPSTKKEVKKPTETVKTTPIRPSTKPKAPSPPKIVGGSAKKETPSSPVKSRVPDPPKTEGSSNTHTQVKWDKKVLDSLESQGFHRTDSSSRLVYNYKKPSDKKNEIGKENIIAESEETKPKPKSPQKVNTRTAAIADKAALFESSPSKTQKDPALLSVSERKALFEKNKGAALLPKAPFAMATPIKKNSPKGKIKPPAPKPPVQTSAEIKPAVPQAGGIANKVAALLEAKSTISQEQIENDIREQRQKEMDMLLNRFHKPNQPQVEEEDESDVDEKTAMIQEKTPKVDIQSSSENRRSSGNKRCSKADSPKVAAVLSDVKRIKISPQKTGRLYPSLTDIESTTETEGTQSNNSSFGESIAESDDVNTSFGRDILQAVCKNQTPQKRQMDDSSDSNMSDILNDMNDDYIDEALAYNEVQNNGPTPPKQGRQLPLETSNSFHYKSFQKNDSVKDFQSPMKSAIISPRKSEESPTYVVDGDNVLPLTHTVSFYRKQQTQTSNTPVRQISRPALIEEGSEECSEDQEVIDAKIDELDNEIEKQDNIIKQASYGINHCNSTPEFMGSTEHVEFERVLLVATHRRRAALHERQRLTVESSLKPQGQQSNLPLEKGRLSISKIVLPLKEKYVTALAAAGGKGHHVVCLVKYGEQVIPTSLVSTVATNTKNPDTELQIPGTIKLENVYSDFTVTFEVYCLQAQEEVLPHEVKYHIKKPTSKLTPKKSKQDSRLIASVKESPAGPYAVRSPTFALMGYVVISVQSANKKQWTLNNTPSMSPLEGTVKMNVSCQMDLSIEHRGFLTMFEDVSGFGAWHRRWCLLKGHILSYWKYPDDEKKTAPINSIDLRNCITRNVGPVSREICARLHTFLIETERSMCPHDKESLVMVRKGNKTIIRHLLSADTKEERIEWCNKFNAALTALRMWGKETA